MKERNHFETVILEMHFLKRAICSLALEGNPLVCAWPCPSWVDSLLLMWATRARPLQDLVRAREEDTLGPWPSTRPCLAGVEQVGLPVLAEEVIVGINVFCFCMLAITQKKKWFLTPTGNVFPLLVVTRVPPGHALSSEEAQQDMKPPSMTTGKGGGTWQPG